jgi:signal transduction histidine kinase
VIVGDLCLTLADRDLKIGNGELRQDVAICFFDLALLPSGAGEGEQILNQSLHPFGAVHRVVDVFVGLFIEFPLIALGQELRVGGNHAQRLLQIVRSELFETGMWEGELIHRKRDGSIIVVASAWALHRNAQGQPARILEVNVDITARKQAEQTLAGQSQELVKQAAEIRKLNDELEQRVVQRTAQLEAANKELEAFTYSVSHDLRAPLRHIGGFSKILVEEFGPTLDPTAQHYLQRIEDGTRRMGLLVDELLNLARVGRHSLSLQVTGLNSIVAEVVSMLKPESEGRQVEWIIADLPFVECDPVLIKQVLQNLMANALKFTRPRPRAVIEIGQVEENGSPAIFVRDNGVGFSMKYSDKLFGVFQRLHRPEDFEGTGIGLATVQRIIQKHGGRVWVEAELDRGATFYFSLAAHEQLEVHRKKEQKDNAAMIGA